MVRKITIGTTKTNIMASPCLRIPKVALPGEFTLNINDKFSLLKEYDNLSCHNNTDLCFLKLINNIVPFIFA